MYRNAVTVCILSLCSVLHSQAQDSLYVRDGDTLRYTYTPLPAMPEMPRRRPFLQRVVDYFGESSVDKTFEKKIDFSFVGGPSYSKNTNFGIGVIAVGLYRIDRTDSITPPSDVSIFANVSVSGFYAVGVTGNNIFAQNRSRVDYTVSFSSAPRSIWGIGYLAGRDNPEIKYKEKHYQVQGRYLHRVLKNTFLGGIFDLEHTRGLRLPDQEYIAGERTHYTATGLGLIAEYDSRDFIPNPARGLYVCLQEMLFPKGLGNCGISIWRTIFRANYYRTLWRGGILAGDLYAEFNSDGTPWPMLARMGGSHQMRGYYAGRYTDNDMATFQVELRQRIWRRIGGVVWGGAGNVFPRLSDFRWSQTLPNYGLGLRWEFKSRINVRMDYGFGKKTSGFLLSINEAF